MIGMGIEVIINWFNTGFAPPQGMLGKRWQVVSCPQRPKIPPQSPGGAGAEASYVVRDGEGVWDPVPQTTPF